MSYSPIPKIVYASSIRRFEFCFAFVGFFFYSTALTNILETSSATALISPVRYLIIIGSIYGITLNIHAATKAIQRSVLIWPLFFLTVMSVAWSINPAVTIQSLRSDFIPATLFGLYLAIRFNRREIFYLLYISTLVGSIISIFYAVALPSIGRHPFNHEVFPGAWKGIFAHKNSLGFNLAITSVCIGVKLICKSPKFPWQDFVLFVIIICEIFASNSMSSLAISTLVILLIWIYRHYRWRGKTTALFLNFLITFVAIFAGALAVIWVPMMTALGRDPTLTGRTLIWDYLLNYRVALKPILGYGRATTWKDPAVYSGIYHTAHHIPAHAHNGYIDLLVDLGYLGLFLFIISLVCILRKTLRLAYQEVAYENVWPIAFIMLFTIYNISESLLLLGASFTWVIYVAIASSNLAKSQTTGNFLDIEDSPPTLSKY